MCLFEIEMILSFFSLSNSQLKLVKLILHSLFFSLKCSLNSLTKTFLVHFQFDWISVWGGLPNPWPMQKKIVTSWKEQKEPFLMSIFFSTLSVMTIVMVKSLLKRAKTWRFHRHYPCGRSLWWMYWWIIFSFCF